MVKTNKLYKKQVMQKKPRLKLVYKGSSQKEADLACNLFWERATPQQRMEAITQLIEHTAMLKGIKKDAFRLCRTTAIIKRP